MPGRVRRKREAKNLRRQCRPTDGRLDDGSFEKDWYEVQRSWSTAAMKDQVRVGNPQPNSTCFTEIKLSSRESEEVWPRMMELNDATAEMGRRAKQRARQADGTSLFDRELQCWNQVVSPMMAPTETSAFQCNVAHSVGVRRRDSTFNVQTSITDEPLNRSMPEKMRHYLAEQFRIFGNRVRALPVPSHRVGSLEGAVNDTTTVLATWGGHVKISFFMGIPNAIGPAMRYTKEMSNKNRDAIEDGVAVSNIAILVLPCLLATVPLAAVEGVSRSRTLLIYIIATDLISVLPLAIKGVEMLVQARRRYVGCVAWNVGVEGEALAVVELWCANCTHHTRFQVYGWSFLFVALAFMVGGVVLEVFAFRVQKRALKGIHYDWWWVRSADSSSEEHFATLMCTEYDCCGPFAPSCGTAVVHDRASYFSRRRAAASGMQAWGIWRR